MANQPSSFVWYELMTPDAAAAQTFYTTVVGWGAQDAGMEGMPYTLWLVGSEAIGGCMALSAEDCSMGAQPGWIGYVGVDDVDAAAQRLTQAGGAVHRPAEDIPGVGRFAVVADPQGAAFVLFKGTAMEAPVPAAPGTPGHIGWHELQAGELGGALSFYTTQFGWTKADAMDMGPMGTYQLFATGAEPVGGMMNKIDAMPVPFWLYYFNVDAIGAAIERVKAQGGQVLNGPQQVPGGSWIAQCMDPQGAMFALVAPK